MKEWLFRAACALGMDAWGRRRRRKRLLVLMYHGVVAEALDPFCWHQLPLASFRRQMRWVARHYQVFPLEQALDLRAQGRLPERACAITFDDGFRNVATRALPVLRKLRLPATVFLPTDGIGRPEPLWPDRVHLLLARTPSPDVDLADFGLGRLALDSSAARACAIAAVLRELKRRPRPEKDAFVEKLASALASDRPPEEADAGEFTLLSWPEVEAIHAEGLLRFAAHSRTHEILSRCDDAEVRSQVIGSQEALERLPGPSSRVFAYPNGRAEDFDARARAAVEDAGMCWALATATGLVGDDDDDLALPRISVGADLSFARFRLLASSGR